MIEIRKTVIVPFTAETMYNLVSDVENYSKYLPWCRKSEIRSTNAEL